MARLLIGKVNRVRQHLGFPFDECVTATKCNASILPLSRVANGSRAKGLSTSPLSYCQSKDSTFPPNGQNKGMVEDGHSAPTEQSLDVREDCLEPKLVKLTSEEEEKPIEVKAEQKRSTQDLDVEIGQEVAAVKSMVESDIKESEQSLNLNVETGKGGEHTKNLESQESQTQMAVKSGKESLLDLLGAMKVEVTSKKKFQSLKAQSPQEIQAKPKPPAFESTFTMFKNATAEAQAQSKTLNPELVAAASAAAATLPNKSQAESELLRQLREHEAVAEAQKRGDTSNLGIIIADMKVGRKTNGRQNARPANQIRFDDDGRGYTHDRGIISELDGVRRRRGLFTGKRLNIFAPPTDQEKPESEIAGVTLWDIDFANQLAQSAYQLPRNGFEEMVLWTKEGKLWNYPIDNEAGLEEECAVPFHEHIFLEKHLAEGFPSHGPVRHFMELVVTGLAKNPYLTVQQKKEHIAWFRYYFHQKEDILKDTSVY